MDLKTIFSLSNSLTKTYNLLSLIETEQDLYTIISKSIELPMQSLSDGLSSIKLCALICFDIISQGRIQDFLLGGSNLEKGVQFVNFT